MRIIPVLLLIVATVPGPALAPAVSASAKKARKVISGPRQVYVTADVSAVPELKPWAARAKRLIKEWHPILVKALWTPGFKPIMRIRLIFKKNFHGTKSPSIVAYASGNTITFSGEYILRNPDNFGVVIHELTHVIQKYPMGARKPVWLIEGIADYFRYFRYEPEKKLGVVKPERTGYRRGYRTAARFLAWIAAHEDPFLVSQLNAALRRGKYQDGLFKTYTGKSLDRLWVNYLKDVEARKEIASAW